MNKTYLTLGVLVCSSLFLSACNQTSNSFDQSPVATGVPTTIVTPTISPTPTTVVVESDEKIQQLFDQESDQLFDADFKKLEQEIQ